MLLVSSSSKALEMEKPELMDCGGFGKRNAVYSFGFGGVKSSDNSRSKTELGGRV